MKDKSTLTEEQKTKLQTLLKQQQDVIMLAGQTMLQKQAIVRQEAQVVTASNEVDEAFQSFGKELNTAYGEGVLSLSDGTFTPKE